MQGKIRKTFVLELSMDEIVELDKERVLVMKRLTPDDKIECPRLMDLYDTIDKGLSS